MRPQTSETFVREITQIKPRPHSSKLMTQTQIRNLSARNQLTKMESRPQVEIQYNKFICRNFGALCDKGYFEDSKQIQLQKFGRAKNSSQIIQKAKVQTNQPVKKLQVYKLIDVDARSRLDYESLSDWDRVASNRKIDQINQR